MKKYENLKLPMELVPEKCMKNNLHNILPKECWDILRRVIYKKSNYKCEICNTGNVAVECHEVWSYSVSNMTQKLEKLECLCPTCHGIKHLYTENTYHRERLNLDERKALLNKVNGFTEKQGFRYRHFSQHLINIQHRMYYDLNIEHIKGFSLPLPKTFEYVTVNEMNKPFKTIDSKQKELNKRRVDMDESAADLFKRRKEITQLEYRYFQKFIFEL